MSDVSPTFEVTDAHGTRVLALIGNWTVETIGGLDAGLRHLSSADGPLALDVSRLGAFDTAGAYLVDRTVQALQGDAPPTLHGNHDSAAALIEQVRGVRRPDMPEPAVRPAFSGFLERTGRASERACQESLSTMAFLGEAVVTSLKLLFQPARIRWTSVVAVMEEAGLDALPIVAFLSFFVGMVVAFIGASTLAEFGATIFTVELVGISVLREFGVILTAIILAGRTNSAFTAQIGAMRMRQEIDAMTTLGLSPMDVLVAPRIFAMVLMTPVLTFVAIVSGLAGGILVGWLSLDIPPAAFMARLQDYVGPENFWVGMSKAPLLGLVVALIGCRQGLQVGGSVQSLGHHTTTSVVQAIFSIIVIDAIFAIFYMELGI